MEGSYTCKLISGHTYSMRTQIKDRLMMLTKVLIYQDEKNGDNIEIDEFLNIIESNEFKNNMTNNFNSFQQINKGAKNIETGNKNYDECFNE